MMGVEMSASRAGLLGFEADYGNVTVCIADFLRSSQTQSLISDRLALCLPLRRSVSQRWTLIFFLFPSTRFKVCKETRLFVGKLKRRYPLFFLH